MKAPVVEMIRRRLSKLGCKLRDEFEAAPANSESEREARDRFQEWEEMTRNIEDVLRDYE